MVKVYTRTGDDGTTHCFKAGRISKSDILIECLGSVDELNSFTGSLVTELSDTEFSQELSWLQTVQNKLFDVGGALATIHLPEEFEKLIGRIEEKPLEDSIDSMDEHLEPIKQFILPGGTPGAARAHVCRSVCRRAERDLVRVLAEVEVDAKIEDGLRKVLRYLNRLSDFFFVLARFANKKNSVQDIFWSQE